MRILYLLFFMAISHLATAQIFSQSVEGGLFVGLSTYGGDLNEDDIELTEIHPAAGIFARYNIKNYFTLKAHFVTGALSGDDLNATTVARRKRNLRFTSPILEFGIIPEFNIYSFRLNSTHVITPYAFVGIGFFYFNPKTTYEGEKIELQPLGTEGQGLPGYPSRYSRFQISIPHGLGVKVAITPKSSISFEFAPRFTFTDYLDDVSSYYVDTELLAATNGVLSAALSDRTAEYTGFAIERDENERRGNPDAGDWYYFAGVTISVYLYNQTVPNN